MVYNIAVDYRVAVMLCSLAAFQSWVKQSPQHLHGRNDGFLWCEGLWTSKRWVWVFLALIWILGWCLSLTTGEEKKKKRYARCPRDSIKMFKYSLWSPMQKISSLHIIRYPVLDFPPPSTQALSAASMLWKRQLLWYNASVFYRNAFVGLTLQL